MYPLRYTPLVIWLLATTPLFAADAPLSDAVAVWHFDRQEAAAQAYPLQVHGAVTLGVPLEGVERADSLRRGGNGKVARFAGGYLAIGGPSFDPPGAVFTLLLRVRDPHGRWRAPLLGSYGGDAAVSLYLHGVDGATLPQRDRNFVNAVMTTPAAWMFGWTEGPRSIRGSRAVVEFLWGAQGGVTMTPARLNMLPKTAPGEDIPPLLQDARNGVQRLMFPMQPLDPCAWHDIIVRGTGAKLQLWLDGVLVDEEFPVGTTRRAQAPRYFGAAQLEDGTLLDGFEGLIDHAALWHRALDDDELIAVSGGRADTLQRELALLGPVPQRMQYYRPPGHNSKAGDCIPFFHDGTFHLFYLVLRRNMHSKWDGGHGGLEIHHASTVDLAHWTEHPVAVPISEQWEAWQGTGGIVHHDGKFWMLYPTPDYEGHQGGIQLVTSDDGEQFTKQKPHPFLPGGDCDVFADPDPHTQLFHLLKAGKTFGGGLPELKDKTLVCWVSPADLDQRGAGVLTVEGTGGQFDSLVLGEAAPRRWMAGSDNFHRTQRDQQMNAEETAKPGEWVQIAAVYAGNTITLYRNQARYARYSVEQPLHFPAGARVILGLRHLDRRTDPAAFFRGDIADARVYATALSDAQIAALRPHQPSDVRPLVWLDFQGGARDRAGTLLTAELEGDAAVRNGMLVLRGNQDCLVSGGRKATLAHWVSRDLLTWKELSEPFLTTDESMVPAMCPHWFRWNDWYYFIGGVGGIWRSRQPFGPWTLQSPRRLDNLAVPKTGAFTGNRRLFAGFLGDDGWGGNLVLRELTQHSDGTLGTRFIPEMIPPSGAAIPLKNFADPTSIAAPQGRAQLLIDGVPNDARITLILEPQAGTVSYGLRLRTTTGKQDGQDGTELRLIPDAGTAGFSHHTHSGSGGPLEGGPTIFGLRELAQATRLDVVCQHDIVDVEIAGQHTLVNRFWNPRGKGLGIWVEKGALVVHHLTVRPLFDHVPSGALSGPREVVEH